MTCPAVPAPAPGDLRAPGQIAYEARFPGDPPQPWPPFSGMSEYDRQTWARIEMACQAPLIDALAARTAERDEAVGRAETAEDEAEELRGTPWPEWAEQCLKIVRGFSGYDGSDDACDGVDLPAELQDTLDEMEAEAGRQRNDARAKHEADQHKATADHYRAQADRLRAGLVAAEDNLLDLARMYGEACGELLALRWWVGGVANEDEMIARLIIEAGDERRSFADRALAAEAQTQALQARVERQAGALKLALEYWAHRQQRYRNRCPVWVQEARAALDAQPTEQEASDGR